MTEQVDGRLVVTEEGLEIPEWLQGFVGEFDTRTPNVTVELTTTEHGLGEHLDALSTVPGAGDYHEDLEAGQMALSAPGHEERIYEIVDERSGGEP